MKTASMVVGLIAGVLGIVVSLIAMLGLRLLLGGFGVGFMLIGLILSVVGLTGAAIVRRQTVAGGIMMLAAGVLLMFFGHWLAVVLFIIAGILGLLGLNEGTTKPTAAAGA